MTKQIIGVSSDGKLTFNAVKTNKERLDDHDEQLAQIAKPNFSSITYPLIVAHRGGAKVNPENTMISFDYGMGVNADGLETDVQSTSDDQLFILHDATLDRTCDLTGTIANLRHDYIIQANAASKFRLGSYTFPSTPIPSFRNYLKRYGKKTLLFPEVKDVKDSTAIAMANMIVKMGLQDSVMVQSFQVSNLQAIKNVDSRIKTLALYDTGTLPTGAYCKANGIDCVAFSGTGSNVPSASLITDWKTNGVLICVWTLDTVGQVESYFNQGVDMVFTNDPAYLKQAVNQTVTLPYTWQPPSIVYGANGGLGSGMVQQAMDSLGWVTANSNGIGYTSAFSGVTSMCIGRKTPNTSYTISCNVKVNLQNADATRHFGIFFASDNDNITPNWTTAAPWPNQNSYNFGYRQNGQVFYDKVYNNKAYVSTTSAVGAFPTYATGDVIPLQIIVTPTTLTFKRTDGSAPIYTVTDNEFSRKGFIGFYWSSQAVSFGSVTIS